MERRVAVRKPPGDSANQKPQHHPIG